MDGALLGPAWSFALVLFRTFALVMAAPVLGARSVPARVKMTVGASAALCIWMGAGMPQAPLPGTLLSLSALAATETALGLCAGLCARALLDAASSAAQTAGLSMGLGFGSIVDPLHGAEATALSELLGLLALGFAVALGLHKEAFVWLASSVRAVPPGSAVDVAAFLRAFVGQALYAVGLSARLAFPLLSAVMVGHLTLGLLGRAAPQWNLSTVGFSVAIVAGGAALFLLAPQMARIAATMALTPFGRSP